MKRVRMHPLAAAVLVLLLLGGATRAKGGKKKPAAAKGPDAEAVDRAVRRSIEWLDKTLPKLPEAGGTPTKQFACATAGLVYLMAGTTRTSAIAADPVEDLKDYLADYVETVAARSRKPGELPPNQGLFSSTYLIQYTWPLAQAAYFFAELEARGRWPRESRRILATIRDLLSEAQQENGGWGHHRVHPRKVPKEKDPFAGLPLPAGAGSGYPSTLVASTNCVAGAMGVVEAVLGRGKVKGLGRARSYLHTARLPDGNYPYDPSQRSSRGDVTGVSRAGGALLAMHFLGVSHSDPDFRESRALVLRRLEDASEAHGSSMLGLAMTALAMRLSGKEDFAAFRAMYFPQILEKQTDEGNLTCVCERRHMATSCDDPRPGLPGLFGRTKAVYTDTLLTFILLLDGDRLELLDLKPIPAPARGEATKPSRRRR